MARVEPATITINNTFLLDLDSGAFSGWRSPGPKIIINEVFRCIISGSAFASDSVVQSVTLRNISVLRLSEDAFQAYIGHLQLDNVSLSGDCRDNFFGGRTGNLSLTSVRINEIGSGCLQAGDGWDSLTIRSSTFGAIQPFSISGSIGDVVIESSRLGRVRPLGLQLNTSTFTMNSTEVGELAADALDVEFNQSASLQTSTISTLRGHAFRRLRSRGGAGPTLAIRRLFVGEAEDGSLAFSEHVTATPLDVVLRSACECRVQRRALRLVVEDEPLLNATEQQRRVARQIVDQIRCTAGASTPTLAEFRCRNCSARGEDMSQCPLMMSQTRTATPVWIWPVGGAALLLLLLTVCVGMALAMRRRRQPKERQPRADSCRIDLPGQSAAAAESHYSEIPAKLRPDVRQTTSADAVTSTPDRYHHFHRPEHEHAEANAPNLQPPGQRSTEYVEMSLVSAVRPGQPLYANCDDSGQQQQQSLYANCDAEAAAASERPVYANLGAQRYQ